MSYWLTKATSNPKGKRHKTSKYQVEMDLNSDTQHFPEREGYM